MIDDQGENLGVMALSQALSLAKEKGLDLIEISAAAKPPVVRIISYDKLRYQEEKQLKKQRQAQKAPEMKVIQISAREGLNDLKVKAERIAGFFEKGHKVEIKLQLRGREKGNKEWALKKLEEFIAMIEVPLTVTAPPKFVGRGYTTQISKK